MKSIFNIKSDYSLLCSLIKVNSLFEFCNSCGISRISVCDNNLSSSIEMYDCAVKNNIKLAIGINLTIFSCNVKIYAKNYNGYRNLLKINSAIDCDDLCNVVKNYCSDLIVIVSYSDIKYIGEFDFFSDIYIGYENYVDRDSILLLGYKCIYNKCVKVLDNKYYKYLKYLNDLGGSNNLVEDTLYSEYESYMEEEFGVFFDTVNLVIPHGGKYIPSMSDDDEGYLRSLACKGLDKRLNGFVSLEYKNRLMYELDVISNMGFTSYFLIVYDYCLFAKKSGILIGPGRGSAAGSLVCYSLGITSIDPLKYDLLFERFLNVDRVSMPDIDIDFDSQRRDEVINYVKEKYGKSNVAVGSTYNTLKSKLVLREVGKLKKVDDYLFDKFLKVINSKVSLKENYLDSKVLEYIKIYPDIREIYEIALVLEGLKKNVSTHAAGVVICSTSIDDVVPIYVNDDFIKVGIPMEYLEKFGILKMDFLGLRNLNIVSRVLSNIDIDITQIDLEDSRVLKMFCDGKSDGIFQYETYLMKELLLKLKPRCFNDLIAAVALVRPGSIEAVNKYISGMNNISSITYMRGLKPILEETYGVILYQEQIIKILVLVGGFSNSDADIIRRAISKKNIDSIKKYKEIFINNGLEKGYTLVEANNIFNNIEKFAGYGFNKSHSVAYALFGYQMAYLKTYYNEYFYNEYLSNLKDSEMVLKFIKEEKARGIKVYKGDVNYSKEKFCYKGNNLLLPLSLISGVTSDIESNIISNAPYDDIFDFLISNKNISDEVLDNLIKADAFRSTKLNVSTLLFNVDRIKRYASLGGGASKPILEILEDDSKIQLSNYEYMVYGFYINNHPASNYNSKYITKLSNIVDKVYSDVYIVGKVEKITNIKTKNNMDMAFISISDDTLLFDVVSFSDTTDLIANISLYSLVKISGRVTRKNDKVSIVLKNIVEIEGV